MNLFPVPVLGLSHCSQGQHLKAEIHGFGGPFLCFWKVVRGNTLFTWEDRSRGQLESQAVPWPQRHKYSRKGVCLFCFRNEPRKNSQLDGFQKRPQQMCLEATLPDDHRNTTKFIAHIISVDEPKATLERTNQNHSSKTFLPLTMDSWIALRLLTFL